MPHAAVALVRRCVVGSEEEGDAKHVAADVGPAQLAQRKKITTREWACYHMHDRNPTSHAFFVYGKRLYQEWVVDQYSKVESQWLFYIRNNQSPLRVVIYGGVVDAIANNDANINNLGRLIVLPSSFTWLSCTKIPWPLSANMASLICSSP